jgi:3-hydroxyacyl-CoA dehydrogenase
MTLALDQVRRLVEWNRENSFEGLASVGSSRIENVGILGAGMMGRAIASAHVEHQVPVVISDVNEGVLAEAAAAIAAELPAPAGRPIQDAFGPFRATADAREAARCDLVLESIVESLPTKRRLFAELQSQLASHAIVASNTSTIPIGRLAEGIVDASRFCGMHFFHPVRHRPLVEIVRGAGTSDQTIAAAIAHVRRIGRMPIVERDGPGFLVNRLLFPYLGEALELLQEGVPAEAIERAADEFGLAIGPLRLMDEIGLDTTLQAGWVLSAAFPERIVWSPLLVSMVKAGRLGRKTGAGFYVYGGSSNPIIDCTAVEEIAAHRLEKRPKPPQESLALRLVLPMLLEATRILEEGVVCDARSIDLAAIFGLGFPADKGGLLWWADCLGPERILAMLRLHGSRGDRSCPTPMLLFLGKTGGRFHP